MAAAKSQPKSSSRRKIALVIGIGDYKYNAKLKNSVNDADAMESTLKYIGFIVTKKTNATHDEIEDAILSLKRSIQPGDMVLLYFAGHGIQWEVSI